MQVAHFENVHRRFGNIRLLLVIATLIAAWFSLHLDAFSPWWLLLALAVFLAIAILHAKVLRQRACAERPAAVAELRSRLDLREDIAFLGEDLKVGIHPNVLTQWAEAPNQLTHRW